MQTSQNQKTKTVTELTIEFFVASPKTRLRTVVDFATKVFLVSCCYSNPGLMGILCAIQCAQAIIQLLISPSKEEIIKYHLSEENVKYHQMLEIIKIGLLIVTGIMYVDKLVLLPTIIYIVGNLMTDGMSFLLPQQNFTDLIKRPSSSDINKFSYCFSCLT
jgi:hypothetical protein